MAHDITALIDPQHRGPVRTTMMMVAVVGSIVFAAFSFHRQLTQYVDERIHLIADSRISQIETRMAAVEAGNKELATQLQSQSEMLAAMRVDIRYIRETVTRRR